MKSLDAGTKGNLNERRTVLWTRCSPWIRNWDSTAASIDEIIFGVWSLGKIETWLWGFCFKWINFVFSLIFTKTPPQVILPPNFVFTFAVLHNPPIPCYRIRLACWWITIGFLPDPLVLFVLHLPNEPFTTNAHPRRRGSLRTDYEFSIPPKIIHRIKS